MRKTYKVYSELRILLKNIHYLSFLAMTIAECQIQLILTLKMIMMRCRYVQNTHISFRAEIIPRKHHFGSYLAVTIAVCHIQMILNLILPQNGHDGMGIRAKHKNCNQSGNASYKTPFWVVFGYSNCSVSNANNFNTHSSSKSTCWDGDMRKTYKFYSERKSLLKNLQYLSVLAITFAVCPIQMILSIIPLQNTHGGMGICAIHSNFIQSGNHC